MSLVLLLLPSARAQALPWETMGGVNLSNPVAYVEVDDIGVRIPIPNAYVTYHIGQHLPLLQENDQYFIARIPTTENGDQVAAFLKREGEDLGAGWVTKQNLLIFGKTVRSHSGYMNLRRWERIPVFASIGNKMLARISRHGSSAYLLIPKRLPRTTLVDAPPATKEPTKKTERIVLSYTGTIEQAASIPSKAPTQEAQATKKTGRRIIIAKNESGELDIVDPNAPPPEPEPIVEPEQEPITEIPETTVTPSSTKPAEQEILVSEEDLDEPVVADEPEPSIPTTVTEEIIAETEVAPEAEPVEVADTEPVQAEEPTESTPPSEEPATEQSSTATTVVAVAEEAPAETPAAETAEPRILDFFIKNALVLQILLVIALLEGVLIVRRRRKKKAQTGTAEQVQTVSSLGEGSAATYLENLALQDLSDFTGTLKGFSMIELIQFLNSAEETGSLSIKQENGQTIGQLSFLRGELVDAFYKRHRGLEGLRFLLKENQGKFAFIRRPVTEANRTIKEQTMSLLLKLSKEMDETPTPKTETPATATVPAAPNGKTPAKQPGSTAKAEPSPGKPPAPKTTAPPPPANPTGAKTPAQAKTKADKPDDKLTVKPVTPPPPKPPTATPTRITKVKKVAPKKSAATGKQADPDKAKPKPQSAPPKKDGGTDTKPKISLAGKKDESSAPPALKVSAPDKETTKAANEEKPKSRLSLQKKEESGGDKESAS